MTQSSLTLPFQKVSERQREVSVPARLLDLDKVNYRNAWEVQKECLSRIRYSGGSNALIICQHPHTITQGRTSKQENILISESEIKRLGIDFYKTDRGGDVTYHGPGQIVAYPIFDLGQFKKDLKYFLKKLEEVANSFLKLYNIKAKIKQGFTGVWVDEEKIASIGIGVRNWITYHGIAININPNLDFFSFIKPCGLDVKMTSVSKILNKEIEIDYQLKHNLINIFEEIFNLKIIGGVA